MTGIVTFVAVFGATALCYFAVGRLVIAPRERLPLSHMRAGDIIHTMRRAAGVLSVRYPADRVAPGPQNQGCTPPCPEGQGSTSVAGDA